MSGVAGAIIGAGGSLASSALSFSLSRQAEDRNYARTKELMREQNDFNMQMWQRNNQYNSPANQRRLLEEAGYNPALYGQNASMASPQSTEVTSATGQAPYNSSAGSQFADSASRTIDFLSKEVQIARLREELRGIRMHNRDFANELEAKEALRDNIFDFLPDNTKIEYDENGVGHIPDVTVHPKTNAYMEDRQLRRMGLANTQVALNQAVEEYNTYVQTADILRKMPKKQYESLLEDLKTKINNNEILGREVKLMQEYGISPNDKEGWMSLIKIMLTNPDAATKVIDNILKSGFEAVDKYYNQVIDSLAGFGDGSSFANPSRLMYLLSPGSALAGDVLKRKLRGKR